MFKKELSIYINKKNTNLHYIKYDVTINNDNILIVKLYNNNLLNKLFQLDLSKFNINNDVLKVYNDILEIFEEICGNKYCNNLEDIFENKIIPIIYNILISHNNIEEIYEESNSKNIIIFEKKQDILKTLYKKLLETNKQLTNKINNLKISCDELKKNNNLKNIIIIFVFIFIYKIIF